MHNDQSGWKLRPPLGWVWPIACSVWIGLFVDGWVAQPSVRNRLINFASPVFETLLMPALTILGIWCLLTTAGLRARGRAILLVVLSSLPIAYLAHQRPGRPWLASHEFLQYYLNRYYLLEIKGLPFFEAVLALVMASICLLSLNRLLSQVAWRTARTVGGPSSHDSLAAADPNTPRSAAARPHPDANPGFPWLLGGLSGLLVGGVIWQSIVGKSAGLPTALQTGCLIGSAAFLWVWLASEFQRPWRSFAIMLLGVAGLATWPQLGQLSRSPLRLVLADEFWIGGVSMIVSLALCGLSLVLLTRSGQVLQRGKPLPFQRDMAGRPQAATPLRSSAWRFWVTGALLWACGLGTAAWVVRNLDPEELTNDDRFSVRDAWLAARFLERMGGERDRFSIKPDPNSRRPSVHLQLAALDDSWRSLIELLERRAAEGEQCSLAIDALVSDFAWLESLLQQGIEVTCGLDAQGQEIPSNLLTMPGLALLRIHNTSLTVEQWGELQVAHNKLHEIVGCRLPDKWPTVRTPLAQTTYLIDCEVSSELLRDMIRLRSWPVIELTLINPRFRDPIDGLTWTQAVFNVEILGPPPLISPVQDDFPTLIVPTFVSASNSRWQFSTRPVLLNSQALARLTAEPVPVPRHLGFDDQGRLTELGVAPNRDCPASIPWVSQPDVEHLYVNLTLHQFDARSTPDQVFEGEEIGFQVSAFPQLKRATIYSYPMHYRSQIPNDQIHQRPDFLDPRQKKFLQELLQHPGLLEVRIESNFGTPFWEVLTASPHIERLIVDSGYDPHQRWVTTLASFPRLKELVIVDRTGGPTVETRRLAMQAYLQNLNRPQLAAATRELAQGRPAPSEPDFLEGAALDAAVAKAEQEHHAHWTQFIGNLIPNARVEIKKPTDQGPNLRWP